MPDKQYSLLPISFERGLAEQVEDSMIPVGALSRLRNWEPSSSGEVRARTGWSKGSTTGAPSSRLGRGIGHVAVPRKPKRAQAPAYGNVASASTTSTTVSPSWLAATSTGSLLILLVTVRTANATSTISTPAGWTEAVKLASTVDACAIYYKANAASASGAQAVTVGTSGAAGALTAGAILLEYKNIATVTPVDQTDSNAASNTVGPVATTSAQAIELAVGTGHTRSVAIAATSTSGVNYSAQTNSWLETADYAIDSGGVQDMHMGAWEKFITVAETSSTAVTNAAGTMAVNAMATFKGVSTTTSGWFTHAVDDGTDSYDIYYIDRDSVSAGTHTLLEAVVTGTRSSPVAFTSGLGNLFYTNAQWSAPRRWDGDITTTPAAVTGTGGGTSIAFHKNRLFVAGTVDQPSRVYYSDIGTYSTFGATSYIDISQDDGETVEEMVPFQDALIIGKQTGLWVLYGSGHDTFVLKKLPVGGIAPGRTLMPTPYGCVAAGRKHVWLIDGEQVNLISRPIRNSYAMTGTFMSTSFIEDVCYISDSATGNIWAINLATGAWWEERMSTSEGPSILFNQDYTQLMSPVSGSVGSSLNYRLFPGSSRGKDFDTLSTVYSMYTPQMSPVGPEYKFTPRHLFLRVRQRGAGAAETGLTITPVYNGTAGTTKTFGPETLAGVYRYRLDLGSAQGINTVQFYADQTLPSTHDTAYDIEEATLGIDVEETR